MAMYMSFSWKDDFKIVEGMRKWAADHRLVGRKEEAQHLEQKAKKHEQNLSSERPGWWLWDYADGKINSRPAFFS